MKRSAMAKPGLATLRRVLLPVIDGCAGEAALRIARGLGSGITLAGIIALLPDESLSAAAAKAQQMRRRLRALTTGCERFRSRARVLVSREPWSDLRALIQDEDPDLVLLDWPEHLAALRITPTEALRNPPCNIGLVRGPVPEKLNRVLAPVRGGRYAELALRIGLSLRPCELTALHVHSTREAASDLPYRGLERVLARLPEVQKRTVAAEDVARTILEMAAQFDLTIVGATARPMSANSPVGLVADRILGEMAPAVLVVKTRRPMPEAPADETISAGAISILVDRWFAENTFDAKEFADVEQLVALKRQQDLTISLALPALNEEETVGKVIRTIQRALMDKAPLLDEMVLIDSGSSDSTREIAARFGLPVHIHQQLLPELGTWPGKGEALWKSLLATKGDLIAWLGTDIVNLHPRFVYGVIGPLLVNSHIQLVKGFYRRPLKVGDKVQAGGGGPVTELIARPLLNLFFPELSGVVQPLSDEYAGRRSALEQCTFFTGYGVEMGLLIDVLDKFGLSAIAQVDLLERIHHAQTLEALSKMSFAIIQTVMRKLERHYDRAFIADVNKSMKLIRYQAGGYFLDVEELAERERPPMATVPQYQARRRSRKRRGL